MAEGRHASSGLVPPDVTVDLHLSVAPEVAYDAVSDVGRMGEWSPEATGARVRAGRPLAAGDHFTGTNANGLARWHTRCTVVAAERGDRFAFDVSFAGMGISRWEYRFLPEDGGTRVVESWWDRRTGVTGALMKVAGYAVIPERDRSVHNRRNMEATLQALKSSLEG